MPLTKAKQRKLALQQKIYEYLKENGRDSNNPTHSDALALMLNEPERAVKAAAKGNPAIDWSEKRTNLMIWLHRDKS